ncbi:MAG: LemA family protein [Sedimentisphaerales bacterium]|jgi:LemA protein|nr:LemA family protein [Sedimentisphaerales bacterium]HNY78668.1 LemA family protein [Sedimentisphaerales bacterium]HOC63863.1 LemA family protein [Sedimentisphaerales bacterium]HOH64719.1 LemA family protein [Sedimentisphaerales bacterium]HPY50939.1 LemA family protein [Sedimentisphaerales bacterium]
MWVPFAVLAAVVLLPILYVVLTYNTLVALRNHIRDAWANIDTELKRRYELIPNLVATVKGYAAHEKEIFERVTQLRAQCMASQGRPNQQAVDENQLVAALQKLMLVVENYPQLKADRNFLELQKELVNTEDRIQAARRFFNGNVRDYRNKCETFPSSLIAGAFGFQPEDYFQVDPAVREVPSAEFDR